jgi:hypothetical protein
MFRGRQLLALYHQRSFFCALHHQDFECIAKTKKSSNDLPPELFANLTFVLTLLSTGR